MLDSSVSSRALGVAGAGLGPGPPIGLSGTLTPEKSSVY